MSSPNLIIGLKGKSIWRLYAKESRSTDEMRL